MKKKIGIISIIIALAAIVILIVFAGTKVSSDIGKNEKVEYSDELVKTGEVVDISKYSGKNVGIKEGGQYILTGEMVGSLVVDTKEDVLLVFNEVNIESYKTAAIINLNDVKLTIGLVQDTKNSVFGGSNKKYSSAVWSKGDVNISGDKGEVVFATRLSSNVPIFSENNINLDSGVVIFTTKNDLDISKFNTSLPLLTIQSKKGYKVGDTVVITDGVQDEVSQFEAKNELSKIYMFSNSLEKGKYFAYKNEELVASGEIK